MSALDQRVAELRREICARVQGYWLLSDTSVAEAERLATADVDALLTTHRRQVLQEVEEKLRELAQKKWSMASTDANGLTIAADMLASLGDTKEMGE